MIKLCIAAIVLGIVTSTGSVNTEDTYSNEELNALKQFREVANELLGSSYERSDMYLVHWLRAKNLDIQEARKFLEKNKLWRREKEVDGIFQNKEALELAKKYPAEYGFANDKHGRPGFMAIAAKWDIRKSLLSGDDWSKYISYHFERMNQLVVAANQSQWLYLADMNHFNLRQHACFACVQFHIEMVRQYENYYPNYLNAIILYNAPQVFDPTIKLIRSLITPHTRKALKVFGHDKQEWQKELLRHFDASQLSTSLGGTKP